MHKIELKGNSYEMGKELGKIFIKEKTNFPIKLNNMQIELGKKSAELLKQYFPSIIEEIKGITDTIEYDNEIFTSWLICMGCCLRVRKNHNVEVRGCTAFSFVLKNKIYYGRDNDLPPYLKDVSKSILYEPKNKSRFILNTSSFVNGEEGINEHGLVVAMTFVLTKIEDIKPGFNSLFLVRYILEKCKDTKEAIEELEKLPIASNCNILLADKSLNMVVAECSPTKINLRYPTKNNNNDDFIVTVNHFTSDTMSKYDASNQNVYSSKARYETAFNSLDKAIEANPVVYSQNILSGKYGFMCQYKKTIKFETIWSTVFDISNKKIYVASGNPMNSAYVGDKRLF